MRTTELDDVENPIYKILLNVEGKNGHFLTTTLLKKMYESDDKEKDNNNNNYNGNGNDDGSVSSIINQ